MLPTKIIIVPIWGTTIPNLNHVHMVGSSLDLSLFDDTHWPFA